MKSRRLLCAFLFLGILLAAQTASEVEITAEPHHHAALENAYVRVFKVEVAPHQATLMHRHRHDYVFVSLGASEVENDVAGKPPVTLKLQDGETHFTPGNFAHIAKNLADTPFRNVTIEFLQDEKAHQTPLPKWDEERGLQVLQGGTKDIMFVQDGVRVSELDLQPGGVIPKHHHAGPHLVVAVTDLGLRSDVEGKPATLRVLKAGDIAWIEGGYTHTVTNVGQQPAKFVALEFQ
jgi:quercetin dioxygenase-like cupin family protein